MRVVPKLVGRVGKNETIVEKFRELEFLEVSQVQAFWTFWNNQIFLNYQPEKRSTWLLDAFGCFWCLGSFRGGHRMRSWTYSSMTRGVWKTTGMNLEKNWLVKYMIESIIGKTTPKREWHSRRVSYQARRWKGQAGSVGSNFGVWKTRSKLWNKCWPQTTPPTSTATTHKKHQ